MSYHIHQSSRVCLCIQVAAENELETVSARARVGRARAVVERAKALVRKAVASLAQPAQVHHLKYSKAHMQASEFAFMRAYVHQCRVWLRESCGAAAKVG